VYNIGNNVICIRASGSIFFHAGGPGRYLINSIGLKLRVFLSFFFFFKKKGGGNERCEYSKLIPAIRDDYGHGIFCFRIYNIYYMM